VWFQQQTISSSASNDFTERRPMSPAAAPAITTSGRTRVLGGITVLDTPLITGAMEYARIHSEPYLFNHAVRSWLFAVRLAQLQGVTHDAEVVAVGTLLHDLGLTDSFTGPKRFEIEGADAAREFAREHGLEDGRLRLIWDSVALNSTPSIGLYKEPEVALCTAGIGVEFGFQFDRIPANEMKSILAAYPRLEMKRRFADSVCRIVKTKPETTYDNFASDFGERFVPGYRRPSTVDFLMNAPFEE
jgi:HD domain